MTTTDVPVAETVLIRESGNSGPYAEYYRLTEASVRGLGDDDAEIPLEVWEEYERVSARKDELEGVMEKYFQAVRRPFRRPAGSGGWHYRFPR